MIKRTIVALICGFAILFLPGAILAYTFIPALAPLIPISNLLKVVLIFILAAVVLAIRLEKDDPRGLLVHYGPFTIVPFLQGPLPSVTLDYEEEDEVATRPE